MIARTRALLCLALIGVVLLSACGSGSTALSSPSSGRRALAPSASPPVSSDWIEYHRDAARAGVGPAEPALSSPAVAWKVAVDGDVYASPLIVAGHVIAATENNTMYSLDVFTGSVIWKVHLGDPVDAASLPCGDIGPVTGITGTPAVDPAGGKVYVVAYLRPHHHVLFALSLVDGSVAFQQDIDPAGSTPTAQQQRGALAIASGRVYVPLGGLYGDCGPYHGYVVAVPLSGGPALTFRVASSREAGIWTAMGATIDPQGDVYVVTGNGQPTSVFDYSDSVIELSSDLQTIKSYFAPSNWMALSASDTDLGALGVTLMPELGVALAVGKDGIAYLLSAGQLGGIGGQVVKLHICSGAYGGTAWMGTMVYVPCTDGLFALSVAGKSVSVVWRNANVVSASPIVSAGVLWAIEPGSGVLYALDMASGSVRFSTNFGAAMHFSTPAATDGFVVAPAGHTVVAVAVVS